MTRVLVSFCNQGFGRPTLAVVDLDRRTADPVDLAQIGALTCTGLTWAGNLIAAAVQTTLVDGAELVFLNPVTLRVHGRVVARSGADLHSLAWQDGTLYAASTGTDELIAIQIERGQAVSETVVWRPPTASTRSDRHHLNSVVLHAGRLLAVAFGTRTGPRRGLGITGHVFDVWANTQIATDLEQPHALTTVGDELFLCESGIGIVRRLHGDTVLKLTGYVRGLCEVGGRIVVGTSKRRRTSRSTGLLNPPVPADMTGTCGLTVVDATTLAVLDTINLDHLSTEIYDVLPLPDTPIASIDEPPLQPSILRPSIVSTTTAQNAGGSDTPIRITRGPVGPNSDSASPLPAAPVAPLHTVPTTSADATSAATTTDGDAGQNGPDGPAGQVAALQARVRALEDQVASLAASEAYAWERAHALDQQAHAAWTRAHDLDQEIRHAWAEARRLERTALEALARPHVLEGELARALAYAAHADQDRTSLWTAEVALSSESQIQAAFEAARRCGHLPMVPTVQVDEQALRWRAQVVCWAAQQGARLDGALVDCRFDAGFFAVAACIAADVHHLDLDVYVFDAVTSVPVERQPEATRHVPPCCLLVERHLAEFPRLRLVRGILPTPLAEAGIERIGYLGIDADLAPPEIGVLPHCWPRLASGGIVVIDGYGWAGYAGHRAAVDRFGEAQGVAILPLPTGQGLLVKP